MYIFIVLNLLICLPMHYVGKVHCRKKNKVVLKAYDHCVKTVPTYKLRFQEPWESLKS